MEQTSGVVAPSNKRPATTKKRVTNAVVSANGSQPNTPSPVKRRKKGEGQVFDGRDAYCWLCHREGKVHKCAACPRVFHTRCLGVDALQTQDWVCTECTLVLNSENVDTRSRAMSMIHLEQLCSLLRFALNRMKHAGDEAFLKPVSFEEFPSYADFVYQPMDLSTLEKNIRNKMYGSTESFLSDAKWIVHNCIIFNGYQHRLTSSAKSIIKVCKFEMNEIEVCPFCYLNSYTSKDNWFCDPCQEPHLLVWAKLKGFPYWPAKAMRVIDSNVDVRFFGAHDRAWIPVNQCFLLCRDIPTASKNKKKGSFEQSMEELELPALHIHRLQERFGPFQYAPFRTPVNPDDLNSHLATFLPQYTKVDGNCANLEPSSVIAVKNDTSRQRLDGNKKLETTVDGPRENNAMGEGECEDQGEGQDKGDGNGEGEVEVEKKRKEREVEDKDDTTVVQKTAGELSSPAKKESAFAQKLDRTIESCKAKLGIGEVEEEIALFDESSNEDCTKAAVKELVKPPVAKAVVRVEEETPETKEQHERTDLDMECSDDGDLVIDLNARPEVEDETQAVAKGGKNQKKPARKSRTQKAASKKTVTAVNPTSQPHPHSHPQTHAHAQPQPHTLPMPAPQPRSPGASKGVAQVPSPSSPGPGCDMNKYSRKMMDFMRGTVEEMFRDMASSGNLEAKVKTLQLEIEKLQWRHQQELAEMKHNADLILLEMRASLESEKVRALTDLRRQCEEEKQKAVEETKKKQWCANCGKDAIFYCCWNTSYCDFSCQSAHWPKHMTVCTQSQGSMENEEAAKAAAAAAANSTGPAKPASAAPPNQTQRGSGCGDGRNSANRREEVCHELWSRKVQDDSGFKRRENEQRIHNQMHMTPTSQSQNNSLANQYANTQSSGGGPVQYIPSNAVQVIPQTSSLANSSAMQVQYVTNSPQALSLSSPVTTSSPFGVASAFPLQQTMCHQSSNVRTTSSSQSQSQSQTQTQTQQRSMQMSNPMYPIVVQPGSTRFGGGSAQASSPPGASHPYPRGPYIPGKPYHLP